MFWSGRAGQHGARVMGLGRLGVAGRAGGASQRRTRRGEGAGLGGALRRLLGGAGWPRGARSGGRGGQVSTREDRAGRSKAGPAGRSSRVDGRGTFGWCGLVQGRVVLDGAGREGAGWGTAGRA